MTTMTSKLELTLTLVREGKLVPPIRTFSLSRKSSEAILAATVARVFATSADGFYLSNPEAQDAVVALDGNLESGPYHVHVVATAGPSSWSVPAQHAPATSPLAPTVQSAAQSSTIAATVVESKAGSETLFPEWPNGAVQCKTSVLSREAIDATDFKHVGWACLVNTNPSNKGATMTTKKRCLGCFECSVSGCKFLVRPYTDPELFAIQLKEARCTQHPDNKNGVPMIHKECQAEMWFVETALTNGQFSLSLRHEGVHDNHKRPPVIRASRSANRKFEAAVLADPALKPKAHAVGSRHRKSVSNIHPAFNNTGTVAYKRRQILAKKGTTNSMQGLLDWQKEDNGHQEFIKPGNSSIAGANAFIFMQTIWMADHLQGFDGAMQTDGIEGIIAWPAHSALVVTSGYSDRLLRVVPLATTILIGGRTQNHYKEHFARLFDTMNLDFKSQSNASDVKPGVAAQLWAGMTQDFSGAERLGFLAALMERISLHRPELSAAEVQRMADDFLRVGQAV